MRLVYFTGIRIGEALELDIDDLDWASGCVHIRKGKTPSARRMAMMPADPDKVALLMADVNRWLKWRNAWNPTTRLLFVSNPNGKGRATTGLHYQSVQRTCHTVSERAGIRPLTPHQLRHTYISVLIANGAPITGITRQADILVAAIGRPCFVTADMVKPGAVVVDVGMNRTDEGLFGDVDFEAVKEVAGQITPVPGGVGPMTIAMLMQNTVRAAELAAS